MACNLLLPISSAFPLLLLLLLLLQANAFASGKEFIVGDDKGWTINFDYQAWAKGKDFRVGDKLVFNYPKGAHNVFRVDETLFQSCITRENGPLESGKDVVTLVTPGKKWYICGMGKHCEIGGQKLVITVEEDSSKKGDTTPTPAPGDTQTSNSAPQKIASPSSQVLFAILLSTSLKFLVW